MHTTAPSRRIGATAGFSDSRLTYIPALLTRTGIASAHRDVFAALDAELRESSLRSASGFRARCAVAVAAHPLAGAAGDDVLSPMDAVEELMFAALPTPHGVRRMNALLRGAPAAAWRMGPVRFSSAHVRFVAPSARVVAPLLGDLCRYYADATLPVTQRAAVALLRLLQIHPFADGNARTARALFLALCLRELPPSDALPDALEHLWRFRGAQLRRTAMHVRDRDDWSAYFSLVLESFGERWSDAAAADATAARRLGCGR